MLPERCVLQLHWRRIEPFKEQLQRAWASRWSRWLAHPFDVLISILHFAPREPDTVRWLEGEGGDERSIYGQPPSFRRNFWNTRSRPCADELLARSARIGGMLPGRIVCGSSISWRTPGTLSVTWWSRSAFGRFGASRRPSSLISLSTGSGRPIRPKQHYWQGRPGLWRSLLTATEARRLARGARRPPPELGLRRATPMKRSTALQADANWLRIADPELCLA